MTLRVGVVGAGIMGADHVSTLRRFVRGAQVTAVADVDRTRAEAAAVDARAYDDAFALITDPDVDAVVVASHDSVHAEQVPQGSGVTPVSQLRHLARIRARVVLPTPRVPVNR